MELCSIASGSSGNCIYAGADHCHVLVDAGISGKRIEAGLNEIGLKTAEMDGILVTHEHSDHIKSLGVLARKYGLPMYATQGKVIHWKSGRIPVSGDPPGGGFYHRRYADFPGADIP